MRLLLLSISLLCFLIPETYAVTEPAKINIPVESGDSVTISKRSLLLTKPVQLLTQRKINFLQRLAWKILKKIKGSRSGDKTSKDTISTIALISGMAGFVLVFLVPVAGFVLLLTAIITGIIGRKNNENPKSRKKALIGLILGLVAIGLITVFVIAYAGGFN